MATFTAEVRMKFGQRLKEDEGPSVVRRIQLAKDGSDSIADVKSKIAVKYICAECSSIQNFLPLWSLHTLLRLDDFSC